jgi:DNA-binding FadR family transcriptional regulator
LIEDTSRALDEEGGRFIKFSAIFHEELARMTGNKVVQHTIGFILTMSPKARMERFSRRDFREMVLHDHERIVGD